MTIEAATRKLDYIDALRGWAVLGVVMVHASQAFAPEHEWLKSLMSEGAVGVQLFYIASAFTLSMSWTARSTGERHQISNFFIRRFWRIAPAFYLAIVTYIFLNGMGPSYWAPNGIKWWFIPVTAAFAHGFYPETINAVVPGGWSVAVEVTFYLLFPALIDQLSSLKRCVVFLGASLVVYALNHLVTPHIFSYSPVHRYIVSDYVFLNFLSQLPVFIVGMTLYRILAAVGRTKRALVIAFGALILSTLLFALHVPRMPHHIMAGLMFAAFAFLLSGFPLKAFVNPPAAMLGKLSFGIYLAHFAVIEMFIALGSPMTLSKTDLGCLAHFAAIVLASAVVASLIYRYVEQPGIAFGKALIAQRERRSLQVIKAADLSNDGLNGDRWKSI